MTIAKPLQPMPHETALARVRPVLLPVGHVGESFCIALLGVDNRQHPWGRVILERGRRGLPEQVGNASITFGKLAVGDFLFWCKAGQSPDQWSPPVTGLALGEWLEVEGHDEADVLRIALSLAALADMDLDVAEDAVAAIEIPRASDEARFLSAVRTEVGRLHPALERGFGHRLSLTGRGAGGDIDFVGSHYATCYAALNPKARASARVTNASAALWRLARLRDELGFAAPADIELTAWTPPKGQPVYTPKEYDLVDELLDELRAQADKEQLAVFSVGDSGSASHRLLAMEHDRVTS
jgi:hypothetical protein